MMEPEVNVVDIAAMTGVVAVLAGWLPNIAAALSIIWLVIRIIETPTVQGLWRKMRGK